MNKNVRRLYESFQPSHYTISLAPDREKKTFHGSVTIRGKKSGRPSQRLTFHQKGLKITGATITKHDKKGAREVAVERINTHASFDEVRLHTTPMLYSGIYEVTLEFNGKITEQMNGIYPCDFELKGAKKQLIATQFESHHTREAFPCIDEPEAKATFDLTLTTPKGEAVIANTPIKKQTTRNREIETSFETTPKMSTYLLAFAYGEMEFKEATTKDGVVVRAYATPDNVRFTDFSLDVAVKCLEFYNDYFDAPYPLAKCDLIALPDFASGAMENWGCITFREQCMLVDPANTSLPTRQYVAMVVAHELAHQWFGNLVTMRWWTDLWLNEGFASWIEYLATDHNFPEWQMWTQFVVDEQQQALKLDALEHTHPIEVAIKHPDEIRTIFDAISYSKGSSVIHMLQQFLGADTFRDGLRLYLKKHAYGNTDTIDLWAALEEVSKQPVKDFMQAWTSQPGYPIVYAAVSTNDLRVNQERFLINREKTTLKSTETWPVPLLPSSPLSSQLMTQKTYEVPLLDANAPFLLNAGRSGLYRTAYDAAHLASLASYIEKGDVSELDRMGILSDTFEAAKAGYVSTTDALNLLAAYKHESNTVVWDIIAGALSGIRAVMNDDSLRETMKPYARTLVHEQLDRLGWEEHETDSHFDKLLRPTILGMASLADEPTVVEEATKRFKAMKKIEDIAPDLRGVIYGTISRLGGKAEFDKLIKLHDSSSSSEERVTLAGALTNFEQPELYKKALEMIKTDRVRLQDSSYWIAYSFGNRFARAATWDWMVKEWDWLFEKLGSDLSFYRMPIYAARASGDDTFLKTYNDFFASVMRPALERPVKQGAETIEWQAAWKKRDLKTIKKFFSN
jgi:puromycin-sensitive aminopeptidase